jgi:hypothetical protein
MKTQYAPLFHAVGTVSPETSPGDDDDVGSMDQTVQASICQQR